MLGGLGGFKNIGTPLAKRQSFQYRVDPQQVMNLFIFTKRTFIFINECTSVMKEKLRVCADAL